MGIFIEFRASGSICLKIKGLTGIERTLFAFVLSTSSAFLSTKGKFLSIYFASREAGRRTFRLAVDTSAQFAEPARLGTG